MSSRSALRSEPPAPAGHHGRFALWPLPDLVRGPEAVAAEPTEAEVAWREGHAAGLREGLAAGEVPVRDALAALRGAAESLQAVQAAFVSALEEQLAALAVVVAQQLVQREIQSDPSIVRDLVRQAVELVPADGGIEVRLHPDDLASLQGQLDLYAASGQRIEIRWRADDSVERGGYLIDTPQRMVDGRVDPVLRALYERIRDA